MPTPVSKGSPPLTRSRTAEHLELLGSCDRTLVLEGVESMLTPARDALRQIQQVYPKATSEMPKFPDAWSEESAGPSLGKSAAVASPCLARQNGRKRYKMLQQGKGRESPLEGLHGEAERPENHASCGLFQLVDDDVLVDIMHLLVQLTRSTPPGLQMHKAVMNGARDLRSLLMTCRRMGSVLRVTGADLNMEMAARAATQITPPMVFPYPFTAQMEREQQSSNQLEVLQKGIANMATHCASPCCQGTRNEFNRPCQRIYPVVRRSTVMAACHSGKYAFTASRRREGPVKDRTHNQNEFSGMHSEWLIRHPRPGLNLETVQIRLDDLSQYSAPQSMRCSRDGDSVALIRAVHTGNVDDNIPHSVVSVWSVAPGNLASNISAVLEPPDEAESIGAINAQDAWWVYDPVDDREMLAVLWSTAYVHPMGSLVGANADNACYFIGMHCIDSYELDTYTGPFYGKAQTVSPNRCGEEVAILVRKAPMGKGPAALATRVTMLHNVDSEEAVEISHREAVGPGRGPMIPVHPYDLNSCPSAVAISPTGDCLVAIHRRYTTTIVEILIRTAPKVFVSVQTIDVAHYVSIGRGEPTLWDPQGSLGTELANALKLPYSILFSPCGRFAAIVDQRPLFGLAITNHALVVLDMALRQERRGVRALPLAPVEDVAPRSLEWTETGIWMQPRHGTLFLSPGA